MNPRICRKHAGVALAWLTAGAALFPGCASPQQAAVTWDSVPQEEPVPVENVTPQSSKKRTAEQIAAPLNAVECESMARNYYGQDPEKGWALLRACISKGDFTSLKPLLVPPWDEEFIRRSNGPHLLAQVIAMRGADVEGDLKLCHERKIPIFSVAAAMAEPAAYKGRLVLVRGTVDKRKAGPKKKPGLSLLVAETAVGGQSYEMAVGPKTRSSGSSSSSGSGSFSGSSSSSRYGTSRGSAAGSYSSSRSYSSTYSRTVERTENAVLPTGRRLVVRCESDDPFLKVSTDYLFLARFDGVRDIDQATVEALQGDTETEIEPPTQEALVSVIAYFEPSPTLSF